MCFLGGIHRQVFITVMRRQVFMALDFIVMTGQDRAIHGAVGPIAVVITIDTNKSR
jgi:hypothetical protein